MTARPAVGKQRAPIFHAVLLAGGGGSRFWPMSRARRPKQFLVLVGAQPMIVASWRRLRRIVPAARIWVVAPRGLTGAVRAHLPALRKENLIVEPVPRDTAPAVGLACALVARTDPDAVVGIFPSDHVVADVAAFVRSVRAAVRSAARGSLVCLGVVPDRPATGFGYLRCARRPVGLAAVAVERFVEKPDEARARRFVRSGRYLWNAGMFLWRTDRFLAEMRRTAPGILRSVERHLAGEKAAFRRAEKTSVDRAVMEKARGVRVVPLRAGWDDVGSWDAVARLRSGLAPADRSNVLLESGGSVVLSGRRRPVVLVGVPDVVVVDARDSLLVVARGCSEKVRDVVDELRRRGRLDLL